MISKVDRSGNTHHAQHYTQTASVQLEFSTHSAHCWGLSGGLYGGLLRPRRVGGRGGPAVGAAAADGCVSAGGCEAGLSSAGPSLRCSRHTPPCKLRQAYTAYILQRGVRVCNGERSLTAGCAVGEGGSQVRAPLSIPPRGLVPYSCRALHEVLNFPTWSTWQIGISDQRPICHLDCDRRPMWWIPEHCALGYGPSKNVSSRLRPQRARLGRQRRRRRRWLRWIRCAAPILTHGCAGLVWH